MVSHAENVKEEDGKREKDVEVQAAVQAIVVGDAKKVSTKVTAIRAMEIKDLIKVTEIKASKEDMEVNGDDD